MLPGSITLVWDKEGMLDIKSSLPMSEANRKLIITVLLDAMRAMVNSGGDHLVIPKGMQFHVG